MRFYGKVVEPRRSRLKAPSSASLPGWEPFDFRSDLSDFGSELPGNGSEVDHFKQARLDFASERRDLKSKRFENVQVFGKIKSELSNNRQELPDFK
jgi:hypothetical protein